MSSPVAMSVDRAIAINGLLSKAHMVRQGVVAGPVPLFHGISLADAKMATAQFSRSVVDASALVEELFTWAVLKRQMDHD